MAIDRTTLLVLLTMTACGVLVASRLADAVVVAAISKCVASAGFLAVAWTAGVIRTVSGRILFSGLVFAAGGDLLLIGTSTGWFLSGLVSFLVGHLLYVAAFLKHGIHRRTSAAAVLPVAVVSVLVYRWLAMFVSPEMAMPVLGYTVVISGMLVAAAGTYRGGASPLIPLGATCFYVSDLSVAIGQFVQPEFPNYAWGLPLYYGGQLMLALGAARFADSGSLPPNVAA